MSTCKLLKGETALITGSNRGIGKAIAETFARSGADLILCSRKETQDFIDFTAELQYTFGIVVRTLFFDLKDEKATKEAITNLVHQKCRIDILVNNAGEAHGGLLQMTSIQRIREIFEVNFFSQLQIIQSVSKLMMRQKSGSIINMASITAMDSFPGYSAYGCSKAALIQATRTLSRELASYNIRINAIAPGLTDTGMAGLMEKKAKEEMLSRCTMKRMAKPSEVANTALFLASDLSSFITGQVLRVDGGM